MKVCDRKPCSEKEGTPNFYGSTNLHVVLSLDLRLKLEGLILVGDKIGFLDKLINFCGVIGQGGLRAPCVLACAMRSLFLFWLPGESKVNS